MREELGSESEEEESVDDDRRHGKSLDYRINVDILDFYGGMHVEEFLAWILTVDTFFKYVEFFKRSRLGLWPLN